MNEIFIQLQKSIQPLLLKIPVKTRCLISIDDSGFDIGITLISYVRVPKTSVKEIECTIILTPDILMHSDQVNQMLLGLVYRMETNIRNLK